MPTGPAARVSDGVAHPAPPVLTGSPGSPDVLIGYKPAWRGIPAGAASALKAAKQASDATITAAESATKAAAGTPGAGAAYTAEQTAKAAALAALGGSIKAAAGASDTHVCTTPSPTPPHGPGVVIDGSQSVIINYMPACRMGDTLSLIHI